MNRTTDTWTAADWSRWRANCDWLDAFNKRMRAEAAAKAAEPVKRKDSKSK